MDTNKHMDLIEKCVRALKEVVKESTDDYINGRPRTAWSFIADSSYGGAYMARKDWNSSYIDLARVCEENKWQDLGMMMISCSTEFYTLEQIATIMVQAMLTWEE